MERFNPIVNFVIVIGGIPMNTRIAAFFDATNMLCDVISGRFVSVYSKTNNKWKAVDRITIDEVVFSSVDQPELYTKELLSQLDGVNVVIAKSFSDLYRNEFLENSVAVATAGNFGKGLLTQAEDLYCSGSKEFHIRGEFKVPANPTAVDNQGHYFLDLISLRKDYPGVTPREVLVPFIRKDKFATLNIRTAKALPWLDTFLETRRLDSFVSKVNGRYMITVTRKLCGDN